MELRPGYKQTDVGIIPDAWEPKAIGDVANFAGGAQPPKSTFKSTPMPGYVRLIQIRDYKTDEFATYIPESLGRKRCTADDIMIGRYGPPIFQILRGIDGAYNVALIKASPTPLIDREFFFHVLQQQKLFVLIDSLSRRSSGQTGVEMSALKSYGLPLPPLLEQRAIAAALSDVDALLGGLARLLAKKRDLKQAAMQQLLTGKRRLPGFDSSWQIKSLGELGTFLKGKGVTKDEALTGELSCVRYGEIYTHHHDWVRAFHSRISKRVAAGATRLFKGDLLFAGSGETKEEIGKCVAIVDDREAFAGGDVVILRGRDFYPMFMGYYCNTPAVAIQKASKGQGDAVVHISASALASVAVTIPSYSEQVAIAEVLSDMDAEIAALEARLQKTRALKQAMMQELLTGRTRLV